MVLDESTIAAKLEPGLSKIRLEFGDKIAAEVLAVLTAQINELTKQYAPEALYRFQRFGINPTMEFCIDWDELRADIRAHLHQQAIQQLTHLRQVAALN